ncbi:hypothetical protein CN507_07415 [Bacillus cereus]|nr:hypothetical protein CN507_07415 [Bacillus cereus]
MKFEDKRMLGIQLGCLIVTEENQYLVIKKNELYSLLNIKTVESLTFEAPLANIEDMLLEDLKETIQDIISPEHIKIVAKNII